MDLKKIWISKVSRPNLLDKLERLETERSFISVFFLGERGYHRRLKEWEKEIEESEKKLKEFDKYLK